MPALSKSLHARALSHGEREEARGEETVEIYRVPLLARVRVLFIRVSSFFFRACVRFVCVYVSVCARMFVWALVFVLSLIHI